MQPREVNLPELAPIIVVRRGMVSQMRQVPEERVALVDGEVPHVCVHLVVGEGRQAASLLQQADAADDAPADGGCRHACNRQQCSLLGVRP